MLLKKLSSSFYKENMHLEEALDNIDGKWKAGKVRGYGVVIISINNLLFAIPLRSKIKHKAAHFTVRSSTSGIKGKGLDFSKSLLILKKEYISDSPFKIPSTEHKNLKDKVLYITAKFEKYVNKYIAAIEKGDINILRSNEYRFTTLVNYHSELGLID